MNKKIKVKESRKAIKRKIHEIWNHEISLEQGVKDIYAIADDDDQWWEPIEDDEDDEDGEGEGEGILDSILKAIPDGE